MLEEKCPKMQHYEIEFEPNTVVVKRILDEEGDVFFVRTFYKEHIGQLIEGIVEGTHKIDSSVVIFHPEDMLSLRIADEWDFVTKSPRAVTSCRLDANDPETWKEIGMTRQDLEHAKERGYFEIRQPTKRIIPGATIPRVGRGGSS